MLLAAILDGTADADLDPDLLSQSHALAKTNEVEGAFARAYPHAFRASLETVERATEAFRENLHASALALTEQELTPILIKARIGDYTYSNFDLVIRPTAWQRAIDALALWTSRVTTYWLEPDKILLHPAAGPAVHLHQSVGWFGVPVIPAETLYEHAARSEIDSQVLAPEPADALRILVAHAAFQTLEFTLGDLLELKTLADTDEVASAARRRAEAEGWAGLYDCALSAGLRAVAAVDRRADVPLPLQLPLLPTTRPAFAHALHVWGTGRRRRAARAVAIRAALTGAKGVRRL